MRTLVLLLLALTLSGCCCGRCSPPTENFVAGAPATLDEARKRASPPDITVDVERITRSAGGGGACHSAVCLIILPVLLFDAIFPEKYDLVTVKDKGVETFSGTFSTNGKLISGVIHLEGGEQQQILAVTLAALDKSMIVESARLKPGGPDGGLTRTPTSLQSQHDFLADYRKALEGEKKASRRGELLAEALKWLDAEALPMVLERIKDPAEPDAARAAVMGPICEVHAANPSPHEPALLAALGDAPGPFAALAALGCAETNERKGLLLARAVAGACLEKDSSKVYELNKGIFDEIGGKPWLTPPVSEAAKACPPERAALFGLQLREEVDRAGLALLLQGSQATTAIPYISLKNPTHRAAYFEAIGSGSHTVRLLEKLDSITLTPDELAQLAKAYVADRIFFSRDSERAQVLSAMKANSAGVDTAAARKVIAAQKGPEFDVALLVLGDLSRAGPASKGASYPLRSTTTSPGDLVNRGLLISGCTNEELEPWLAKTGGSKGPLLCAAWPRK